MPIGQFLQGMYTTALDENELLESIVIAPRPADEKCCVLELARRHGDYASAAVMASARVQGGKLAGLRLVFFAVADTPLLDADLNARLQEAFNRDGASAVAPLAAQGAAAHDLRPDLYNQAATKAHLCGVLASRALTQLAAA